MESLPQACLDATLVATARVLTADHLSGKYFHTVMLKVFLGLTIPTTKRER